MEYEIDNLDEVMKLPAGTYNTRVVEASWHKIIVHYVNSTEPGLFKIHKDETVEVYPDGDN